MFICLHNMHISKYTYASLFLAVSLFLSLHIYVHSYIHIFIFCKSDSLISFLELLLPALQKYSESYRTRLKS